MYDTSSTHNIIRVTYYTSILLQVLYYIALMYYMALVVVHILLLYGRHTACVSTHIIWHIRYYGHFIEMTPSWCCKSVARAEIRFPPSYVPAHKSSTGVLYIVHVHVVLVNPYSGVLVNDTRMSFIH
jgi:hypothetical protein